MEIATAPSTQIRQNPRALTRTRRRPRSDDVNRPAEEATPANGTGRAEEEPNAKESGSGPADDSRRERIPGARHIESPEDLLHVAVGVLATVALFWLIRRGPRFPGF